MNKETDVVILTAYRTEHGIEVFLKRLQEEGHDI